ncbi:MAG: hypothetical protein GX754_10140 [Clostridiaceae bacterium]|nr:hypothetical protein [Clostridiaceae bacterium]
MECFKCNNCMTDDIAYFCPMKNDFVTNEKFKLTAIEKRRSGWKKGHPNYETHRRKTRKEIEV